MAAENGKQVAPAYIAWSFLNSFVNGLRQSGIPLQIDRYVMPTASGSQLSAAVNSLKFLKWLDPNSKPTDAFKQYVKASDEERPGLLRKTLEGAYPFLFDDPDFHLEQATGQMMADKFRKMGVQGATLSKAVAFFLAAAKPAGITISQHIKPPPMPAKSAGKKAGKKKETDAEEEEDDDYSDDTGAEVQRFQIPIPGKPSAIFIIPKDLEQEDWDMLKTMLNAYIARLQKQTGGDLV
jgi:hypothetical protein